MSSPAGTVWDRVAALTRSPWFRWGALIAWGGVIWIFGASQVLPMNHGDIGRFLLRKSLHVLVYAILGALLVRAAGPGIRWRWVILVGVLVGLADELHQATVPHRSFRIDDIAIDTVSAMVGAAIARRLERRGGRHLRAPTRLPA